MKLKLACILLFATSTYYAPAQSTLQERLGYSKSTKLLILHADDLGVSHSENVASIEVLEKGSVNSASIMVPCPWFPEIADYARKNPKADFGLHLTLTSEWKYLKWSPVASRNTVPGLVNNHCFMYSSVDSVHRYASAKEVETEMRAQIERALQFGIDVTHLDSHMGAVFGKEDFLKVFISLGREYKVPVLLSRPLRVGSTVDPDKVISEKDVVLDMIYTATPQDFKGGMENYYTGVFKSLKPGVSIILLHAAYDDTEMQAVTIDHPDWGAAWRQADVNFFMSENYKRLIKENNIQLITWREIRDKTMRPGK